MADLFQESTCNSAWVEKFAFSTQKQRTCSISQFLNQKQFSSFQQPLLETSVKKLAHKIQKKLKYTQIWNTIVTQGFAQQLPLGHPDP